MVNPKLKKGEQLEETLRKYFLELGYYVVRSIKFNYRSSEITDIDLWLYFRTSPISRERTNVDIKNKKSPLALERIFWTKGLKEVLGLEKCIVATSDKRQDVNDFGASNDVLVLDGAFLSKLNSSNNFADNRVTEEEFIRSIESAAFAKSKSEIKIRYENMKSHLISKLNFDGVNEYLAEVNYFLVMYAEGNKQESALRLLYISISLLLICLDYKLKDISYKEPDKRVALISEGIRYGEDGKKQSEELVAMSSALVTSFLHGDQFDKKALEEEVNAQFNQVPAEAISEYFATKKMMAELFLLAKSFEAEAYSKDIKSPSMLTTDLQSVIAILADCNQVDRKAILA